MNYLYLLKVRLTMIMLKNIINNIKSEFARSQLRILYLEIYLRHTIFVSIERYLEGMFMFRLTVLVHPVATVICSKERKQRSYTSLKSKIYTIDELCFFSMVYT